jgi:hypothetical protein
LYYKKYICQVYLLILHWFQESGVLSLGRGVAGGSADCARAGGHA